MFVGGSEDEMDGVRGLIIPVGRWPFVPVASRAAGDRETAEAISCHG